MKADAAVQNTSARKLIISLVVLVTVCLVSLIIAGVTSLISLADRIHPIAGTIVFWSVCAAAGFLALYCAIAYARLPAALVPPDADSGPKYDAYLQALRTRLAANPQTRNMSLVTKEEIENAVEHCQGKANPVFRRTPSIFFLSPPLIKNERLDVSSSSSFKFKWSR